MPVACRLISLAVHSGKVRRGPCAHNPRTARHGGDDGPLLETPKRTRDDGPVSYRARPVTVTARVPAPVDVVFDFVSDTRNDPLWCPNVSDVEQVEGSGVTVGSRFRFHQTVEAGSRTLESDVQVEVVGLGERAITWRVEDRFQKREVELTVDRHGETSVVSQTTTAVFKRKPGVARWFYPWLARREFRNQFDRLAQHFR